VNNLTTFYLVRHGNTEWNVKRLLQGHSDSPLTNEGLEQAKNLAIEFRNIKFDRIFSSDLLRAKRTAEIIALEHKIAVEATQLLRERSYGNLEGQPAAEFEKVDAILDKLTDEERYTYKYKELETDEEIVTRFITFMREIAISNPNKNILIVTHGGSMRALLKRLCYGTYEELKHGAVKNGAWVKLETEGVDFFVKETKGVNKNG
jgi:broad specificity phosphatase PhoE